jgi:hypothetical protein
MTDHRILALGLVLALGACAQGGNTQSGAPAEELGTCAAADHQDWVGKRVDVLNDVDLPEGTRVLFPTTPATMDFREDRMNVSVDKNDVIARVYCG